MWLSGEAWCLFKAGGKQQEGETVRDEVMWPAGRGVRGEEGGGCEEGGVVISPL